MTGSVQSGTVPALRNNGKSNFFKTLINSSYQRLECLGSGNRNCEGKCMLRGRGAVLDETRQLGVGLNSQRSVKHLLNGVRLLLHSECQLRTSACTSWFTDECVESV